MLEGAQEKLLLALQVTLGKCHPVQCGEVVNYENPAAGSKL